MKISFFTKLSLQVVVIFVTIILASWVPDLYPKFFGDWLCQGYTTESPLCLHHTASHNPETHWGKRHFLWLAMSIVLFIIQFVRVIGFIEKHSAEKKHGK